MQMLLRGLRDKPNVAKIITRLLNIVGNAGGRVSRIALETLTLQCGALRSVSLRTMASNVPHAPATEESQEP